MAETKRVADIQGSQAAGMAGSGPSPEEAQQKKQYSSITKANGRNETWYVGSNSIP
jgi:hypothetical protein